MNDVRGRIVVTYALRREADPILFDHLASFKKGPHRVARLSKLISKGFEHEKRELEARRLDNAENRTRIAAVPRRESDLLDDLINARVE